MLRRTNMFRLINSLKAKFCLRMGFYTKHTRHASLCEGSLEGSSPWCESFAAPHVMFWCIKQELVGLKGPRVRKCGWAALSHCTLCCTVSSGRWASASLTFHNLHNDCRLTTACQGHVHLHHSCMRTPTATLRVALPPLLNRARLVFLPKLHGMLNRCMFALSILTGLQLLLHLNAVA